MTYFIIFGIVLLLAIIAAAFMARGSVAAVRDLSELESRLFAIDPEAFNNLIDSSEVHFLRRSLDPAQFRRVQRTRILATIRYVREMAANAAVLIKAGQLVLASPDATPDAAVAAEAMVSSALQLRLCNSVPSTSSPASTFHPPVLPAATTRSRFPCRGSRRSIAPSFVRPCPARFSRPSRISFLVARLAPGL
jgi:hypothetical protein